MFDADDAALLVFFTWRTCAFNLVAYDLQIDVGADDSVNSYACTLYLVPCILPPKIQLNTHFWWWSLSTMLIYALALCPLPVKSWVTHSPFGSSCIHIDFCLSVLGIYSPVLRLMTCTGLYSTLHHSCSCDVWLVMVSVYAGCMHLHYAPCPWNLEWRTWPLDPVTYKVHTHTAGNDGLSLPLLCTSILLCTLLDPNENTLALMMVPLCLIYSPVWWPVSVRSWATHLRFEPSCIHIDPLSKLLSMCSFLLVFILMIVLLCLIYTPVWCPVSVRSEESAQETKYLYRLSKVHLTRIAKVEFF